MHCGDLCRHRSNDVEDEYNGIEDNNGLMLRHESEDDWEDASAPPADYLERVQVGAENGITKMRIWEIRSKMLKFGKTERN